MAYVATEIFGWVYFDIQDSGIEVNLSDIFWWFMLNRIKIVHPVLENTLYSMLNCIVLLPKFILAHKILQKSIDVKGTVTLLSGWGDHFGLRCPYCIWTVKIMKIKELLNFKVYNVCYSLIHPSIKINYNWSMFECFHSKKCIYAIHLNELITEYVVD